jgi:hypothetical protein
LITYVIYIYTTHIYIYVFSTPCGAVLLCGAVQCQVVFAEWKAKEGQAGSQHVSRFHETQGVRGFMGIQWEHHGNIIGFCGI